MCLGQKRTRFAQRLHASKNSRRGSPRVATTPREALLPLRRGRRPGRRLMGQALRRASGRLRPPSRPLPRPAHPPPPPSRASPAVASGGGGNPPQDRLDVSQDDVTTSTKDAHGVLEERDPSYDDMLKHMVGRITTKPGGKPEMGEASVVERYNRPLPKVRTSQHEPGQDGHRQLPEGTLNVGHIHEIIQLYQGKSSSHHGPMGVDEIASRFRVEASVVRGIVQFVSLPPQDEKDEKKDGHHDS